MTIIRPAKICKECKKEFFCPIRKNSQAYLISLAIWNKRLFCSNKCSSVSDDVKKKMSIAKIGKKQTIKHIESRIKPLRGKKRPPFSDKWRKNLSISHIGKVAWNKKMKFPERSGDKHHNWKGGVSSEKRKLMVSIYWKEWRKSVFERDDYSCIDCGNSGYVEPHHIIPARSDRNRLFDINNGITLCRPCHLKTFGKELVLSNVYMTLASRAV